MEIDSRTSADRGAIIKLVNYADASIEKMVEKTKYISDPKKSQAEFQKGFSLNPQRASHGFKVIYDRYRPKGTRNFKQAIVAFGVAELEPQTAFQASCEIAAFYEEYPILLCLHTNLPHHIHAHFILGTVNIYNGKKFKQSPADFHRFRMHTNDILRKYSLPLIKGTLEAAEGQLGLSTVN